jgi:hypothetical protein
MIQLLIILGTFFFIIDKLIYKCTKKVSPLQNLLHWIHNIAAITLYVGPFIINDPKFLLVLLFGSGFVLIQGAVSKNRDQQCFLMPIYNRECGLDNNRSLVDIMSITGIKRILTSDQYQYFYYIIQLAIYTFITFKIFCK